ncbi:sugar O-acetyltransferase [Cellulomonas sp. Y8]|uniref:sugar O-acetyltransferase n=1 Tax=Cellulomonas sp. Y8 TaxID=2591145 RepID=UPI003D714D34
MDEREQEVRRRMDAQELYKDVGPGLEALEESRVRGKELAREFNALEPRDVENRTRVLRETFGTMGDHVWVEPPLYVAYGVHTHLGSGIYLNTGTTIVDDSPVHIGDRVMFGPHVTLATAGHPLHPETRATGAQFSAPIVVEDDVWIGANVTVLPGVTIGAGSVVAAGAVVSSDVPANVVVGGVPARILRAITEEDRAFTYRAPRTLVDDRGRAAGGTTAP